MSAATRAGEAYLQAVTNNPSLRRAEKRLKEFGEALVAWWQTPEGKVAAREMEEFDRDLRELTGTGNTIDQMWRLAGFVGATNPFPLTFQELYEMAMGKILLSKKTGLVQQSNGTEPIEEKMKKVVAVIGNDTSMRILSVAKDEEISADEKMRQVSRIDHQKALLGSPKWAQLLAVTEPAIRKTHFWKTERKLMIEKLTKED